MLWLCIRLSHLSLDVFQRGGRDEEPFVVVEGASVLMANGAAAQDGIRAGMSLTAARALLPRLLQRERACDVEVRALERLAGWALQFTSQVSLQPPWSLLLEIGGSLRYFGGLVALRDRLRRGLEALGYRHVLAVAPTPTAACLLARAGRERAVIRKCRLRTVLAGLPAQVLDLDVKQRDALANLGLHTLGDCLALHRGALSRRLGPDLIRQLDRALGHFAEPRRSWQAPPRFRSEQELPAEVHDTGQLLFGLHRLILELCGYLRGIESGTQRLRIRLHHLHQDATTLSVGLVTPSRDPEHLMELVRQRLEGVSLPAPVDRLTLSSGPIQHLPPRHGNLVDHRDDQPCWSVLVERLSARLGRHAVLGLQVREEHRPERVWDYTAPGRESPVAASAERPLWLLPNPLRLKTSGGQPLWRGPLILYRGPERIESGWWDGADISRDYYVARNAGGERVWIFHERRGDRAWYLHGIFA